jgi:hypothetical protein
MPLPPPEELPPPLLLPPPEELPPLVLPPPEELPPLLLPPPEEFPPLLLLPAPEELPSSPTLSEAAVGVRDVSEPSCDLLSEYSWAWHATKVKTKGEMWMRADDFRMSLLLRIKLCFKQLNRRAKSAGTICPQITNKNKVI